MVPAGVQGHDGPADAGDPGGRGAGDLGAHDHRHDGARRGRLPVGRRGPGGAAGRDRAPRQVCERDGPFSSRRACRGRDRRRRRAGRGDLPLARRRRRRRRRASTATRRRPRRVPRSVRGCGRHGASRSSPTCPTQDVGRRDGRSRSPASSEGSTSSSTTRRSTRAVAWTEITEQEWDDVLAVNLKGYFLCARACHPSTCRHGGHGRIVNVASITPSSAADATCSTTSPRRAA